MFYNRIGVSEEIDVNKTVKSKEWDIYYYWCILRKGFKFQAYVWNRYHDLLMMSISLCNMAVLNIKNADYCCIISAISKNEIIDLMQNADLTEKARMS